MKFFMNDNGSLRLKRITGIVVGFFLLCVFAGSFFTVEEYERGVVTTWGKFSYVSPAGLNWKWPLVQSVSIIRTDLRSMTSEKDKPLNTYTADNQEVDIVFTMQYRLPPANIENVWRNAQDYKARMFDIAQDRIKAEMGKVNLTTFAMNRGTTRDGILKVLKHDAEVLGLAITDFQFTNVEYDKRFKTEVANTAVEKQKAETKTHTEAQAKKDAEIKEITARGDASKSREEARGTADAVDLVAKANARKIKIEGEALADAMRAQAEALHRNPVLVEMKKAERWDGALPVQMLSGITPFMQFKAPTKE